MLEQPSQDDDEDEDKSLATAHASVEELAERAIRAVHSALTLADFQIALQRQACLLMDCEHADFYRLESENKVDALVCTRDHGRSQVRFPVGEGIAGSVAQDNGFYLCNEPQRDGLYQESIDGLPGVQVRNVASTAMAVAEDIVGVLQVVNRRERGFSEADAYWLQKLAEHGALAYLRLKRSEAGWTLVRNLAEAVATAVDDKHVSTIGHADRVRQISLAIGREMNLTTDELLELELAALLHDVGRLGLSPEAFELIGGPGAALKGYASAGERLHIVLTEAFLRNLRVPAFLSKLSDIALAHHEKVDGSGYPKGKKSADLSLAARILAVANAFDLLTSGRALECQGGPLNTEEAVKILKLRAGSEFDPAVVDHLVRGKLYNVEKRRFPRYEYEAPLEIEMLGEAGEGGRPKVLTAQILDLSEGGILFRCPDSIPEHALVRMRIALPTDTLEALARIARRLPGDAGQGHKIGAYFLWYGSQK